MRNLFVLLLRFFFFVVTFTHFLLVASPRFKKSDKLLAVPIFIPIFAQNKNDRLWQRQKNTQDGWSDWLYSEMLWKG